jgi:peptidoglycan/xylan/chitin deacetylase (PgdA/CDA1 family)
MTDRLAILMFHVLDAQPAPTCFPVAAFEDAMARLAAGGFRTLRFTEAAALLAGRQALPERAVVLTFDDGDASVHGHAWPVLRRFDMTATVFALPPVSNGPRYFHGRRLLGRDELRQMHEAGIEIGAHTLDHPNLTRLSAAEVENQVRGSRTALEDVLGAAVPSFAYPYGRSNQTVREIVRRHFAYACTDALGLARAGEDPHGVPRIDAYYLRGCFGLLGSDWLPGYLRLRDLPRRARRHVADRLHPLRGGP